MSQKHTVSKGEDMVSIAEQHGFFWETLWEHPDNQSLRAQRNDPSALAPGDVVTLPEKEPRHEVGATGTVHRFRRRGASTELRLQLFRGERPRAREAYELDVDGTTRTGTTDAEGTLVERISVDAREGTLTIGPDVAVYELQLGGLPPVAESSGVQMRLNSLGFDCGRADGTMDEQAEQALRDFQRWCGLEPTGSPDDETRACLDARYRETGGFI